MVLTADRASPPAGAAEPAAAHMLGKHVVIYGLSKVIPAAVGLAAIALYSRILSPDDYGIYATAVATVGALNIIGFQWMRAGLLRFARSGEIGRSEVCSTIAINHAALLAVLGVAWVGVALLTSIPSDLALASFLLLAATAAFDLHLQLWRADLKPMRFAWMNTSKRILALLTGLLLLHLGWGPRGIVLGLAIGACVAIMPYSNTWRKLSPALWRKATSVRIARYGLPISATAAFAVVVAASDRIILSAWLGTDAAGLYAVGYDLAASTITMVMMAIGLAATPLLIRVRDAGTTAQLTAQFRQNGIIFGTLSFPAAGAMIAAGNPLLRLAIGDPFLESAAAVFPVIVVAVLLHGVKAYYLDSAFYAEQRTVAQTLTVLPAALANIPLTVILVRWFGIEGAAYATLVCYGASLVAGLALLPAHYRAALPLMLMPRIAFVTVAVALAILAARAAIADTLATACIAGAIAFSVSIFAVRLTTAFTASYPRDASWLRRT